MSHDDRAIDIAKGISGCIVSKIIFRRSALEGNREKYRDDYTVESQGIRCIIFAIMYYFYAQSDISFYI